MSVITAIARIDRLGQTRPTEGELRSQHISKFLASSFIHIDFNYVVYCYYAESTSSSSSSFIHTTHSEIFTHRYRREEHSRSGSKARTVAVHEGQGGRDRASDVLRDGQEQADRFSCEK